jgi:NAD(P)-dependent dehydrogenase (short-subunit alcohol dehydrogenase family)
LNRIVVVTGASTGLGLVLAKLFVEAGDVVYGTSKTKKNWKSAAHALNSPNFQLKQLDSSIESDVKRFISRIIKKRRKIDILINNAGYVSTLSNVQDHKLSDLKRNMSDNFYTAFLMSKHVLRHMWKENAGLILNIASMAGWRAVPRLSGYSASKFAVRALTEAVAKENDDTNIKCITICPGGMNTRMRAKVFGEKDAKRQQSAEFVGKKIFEIAQKKLKVKSGETVAIRHSRISGIYPLPQA